MFRVMTQLFINKQVKFENGYLEILGIRDSFTPAETYVEIQKVLTSSKMENLIYFSAKESGFQWFKRMAGLYPGLKQLEAIKWGIDLVSLSGWGVPSLEKLDIENKFAIFILKNSTSAKLFGKFNAPTDHMFRGLVAGGMSYILKADLESIEIECLSLGNATCKFLVSTKEKLSNYTSNKDLERQLIKTY